MKAYRIEDLHNLSVSDARNMPPAHVLLRWSDLGLYEIDAAAGRFVVLNQAA